MSNPFNSLKSLHNLLRFLILAILTTSLLVGTTGSLSPVTAAQSNNYCRFDNRAIAQKDQLRNQVFNGDTNAESKYQNLIERHGEQLVECRNRTWPQTQAIWLRLYPCDTLPGRVEEILDHIVD